MKDKLLEKLIRQETKRQSETLNLIPSENYVSLEVLRALGSPLTNKYAEGYSALRYYGGNEYIDKIENLCKERALKLFRLSSKNWHVNVQPYSGSPANLAVYVALVPLGGKIMGMRLDMGGHLTHGHKVSFTGKAWRQVPYGVDRKTEVLNYGEILRIAKKERPKLIVVGFTAYPRVIDFAKFRKIADAAGAYLMVDMSHFAGLVAGGVYPSPFRYADVVTTTVHKTLRGPRAAMIFVRRDKKVVDPSTHSTGSRRAGSGSTRSIAELVDRAVFPGLQGGPHANQIAATAVALKEAASPQFRRYARQIVRNAKTLAAEFKKLGWRIISGGTDTHLLLVDVTGRGVAGKEAGDRLEQQGIIVNKNTIPYDARSPVDPSGIRIGTPALTTRGMKEKEMKKIAGLIHAVLVGGENVKSEVRKLCNKHPLWY